MLRAIAIDDEPMALEVIKTLATRVPFINLEQCFTSAFEAMDHLNHNKPDLLFLDIKMPDISGLDFVRALPSPPMVIFTTAYSEHAVQSFEIDAVDYLLKPFSPGRFLKACNKANELMQLKRDRANTTGEKIFIKSGYEAVQVNISDILYAESVGNYVQFALAGQNIISRLTMAEAEATLPANRFIRIHRSYIIAKQHIAKMDRYSIWIGKTELPIGPAYSDKLEQFIRLNK